MTKLTMTNHAQIRKQQRGFRDIDVLTVAQVAKQVAPDAYMLTRADAAREIARRKREIQQLERLSGSMIVVEGDTVITLYHASKSKQKRALRKGRVFQ